MKKTIIAILLVLVLTVSSVFALDGFTFSAGFGYDTRKGKDLNSSRSLAFEGGIKYPIGNGFSAYTDAGIRFVGKSSMENYVDQKLFYGLDIRAGVLYGLRFTSNPKVETYLGGGISYANTSIKIDSGYGSFFNLGVGFKFVLAYRINDSLAITLTELPDINVFNSGKFNLGFSSTTLLGAMFKF